jgi:hypothetical protein
MTNKMKVNAQTVYTTLPGSSTLEVESIEKVPVYELAERGWINAYYHPDTITIVDENGEVTRTNVTTGEKTTWLTRPKLQGIVTMGPIGYYYEFRQDGSILSSCKEGGVYYWGPIEEVSGEAPPSSLLNRACLSIDALWETLRSTHFKVTDPMEVLREEINDWWDCYMDKRWRRNTSLQEKTNEDKVWLDRMKQRLATDPRIYNNPAVRAAYEDQITRTAAGIQINDSNCSECRREGVCMCYT